MLCKVCCNNGDENLKCGESKEDNYITVNYNNAFSYGRLQFFNYDNSRINLERIFLDDTQKGIMEPLEITDSSTLKVYFDSSIDSLSSFFNSQIDSNCQFIKSVDFSNFATVVPDMSYLFNGCTSLESVNFNNFKGTTVTNMKFIFSNCNIIKSIDLSSFTLRND